MRLSSLVEEIVLFSTFIYNYCEQETDRERLQIAQQWLYSIHWGEQIKKTLDRLKLSSNSPHIPVLEALEEKTQKILDAKY